MPKSLGDFKISHEEFTTIMNQAEKYPKLQESIRMMNILRTVLETDKLIEDG